VGFRRLLRIDWDVIAGIIAALVAMFLSFLGLVSETVGLGIVLLLCALLLTRVSDAVKPSEIQLIGPKKMRQAYSTFATSLYGDVRWFNVCCRMFRRQEVFDSTLRPLLDNPNVTSIRLLCRPEERSGWHAEVLPKLRQCENRAKLQEPSWAPIPGNVSFLIGDVDGDGRNEALVSILDEPFAALSHGTSVPRYLVRVFSDCELMLHIEEVTRYATNAPETAGEISVASHENA
jgi:hypothetical protein